jgi:hypothetical protein
MDLQSIGLVFRGLFRALAVSHSEAESPWGLFLRSTGKEINIARLGWFPRLLAVEQLQATLFTVNNTILREELYIDASVIANRIACPCKRGNSKSIIGWWRFPFGAKSHARSRASPNEGGLAIKRCDELWWLIALLVGRRPASQV